MKTRSIKVEPMSGMHSNCVRVTASGGGRSTRWTVCAVGFEGSPQGLSISRRGRLGGARSTEKYAGGMVACSASGPSSKCVRAPYGAVVYPGGAAMLKRKGVEVFGGLGRKAKKRRRARGR